MTVKFLTPFENHTLRDWPFSALDKDFVSLFKPRLIDRSEATYNPQVDLRELEDGYEIRCDLPGIKKEEVNIEVDDGLLSLSGERVIERSEKDYTERFSGRFHRSFRLPDTSNLDEIEATHEDGVLRVFVPKSEKRSTRRIEIK